MQLIGNQNSLRICVRPTEIVCLLTLEIQSIRSVYGLNTRRALNNEIRVNGTDIRFIEEHVAH